MLQRFTRRYPYLCLSIAALFPLSLYIATGYGGQDLEFHYTLWLALHDAWAAHQWAFGWSPGANYGMGEPSLCFYPPLSPLIGALLSFLLPYRLLPGAVAWLIFAVSGASMYRASAGLLQERFRFPAALLYIFSPALFLLLVLRGTFAEAWVAALLPLVFSLFYRAVAGREYAVAGFAAVLLAAVWLFDIPIAIGIFYGFSFMAAILAMYQRSWAPLVTGGIIQGFAGILACFRLLPVLAEKHWISSDRLLIYDFHKSLQFVAYPRGDAALDVGAAILIVCCVLVGVCYRRSYRSGPRPWDASRVALLVLAGFTVFFQLRFSVPLWEVLPQFRFILFAHRLLSLLVLAAVVGLFDAQVTGRVRRFGAVGLLGCSLIAIVCFLRLPPLQHFASFSELEARVANGYRGVLEYLPAQAPVFLADPVRQQAFLQAAQAGQGGCSPVLLRHTPNRIDIETHAATQCTLRWNVFTHPFWHAVLDGRTSLPLQPNSLTLLEVAVPAGDHAVAFVFLPKSGLRTGSGVVSLLAFLLALGWYRIATARGEKPGVTVVHAPPGDAIQHQAAL